MFKAPEIFIVSSGRSGTTLLVSILNATQQIFIPYESDFIARAYSQYHNLNSFQSKDYLELTNLFYQSSQPEGWGMKKSYIYENLCTLNPQTFADINSAICQIYHEKQGTSNLIWGIKAPVLIASLDKIRQVYPSSKIIHVIRDGRDVYLSYKRVHDRNLIKFGPRTLLENALYWVDGLQRIYEFRKHAHVYELRYEDLLGNPQTELKQLCNFIGIEYYPEIHESFQTFERNQNLVPEKLVSELHAGVKQGINSQNSQKYKSQMNINKRFLFEMLTSPYLRQYRYELEFPLLCSFLISPLRMALYAIARIFNNRRYARRDTKHYKQAVLSSHQ